MFIFLKRPILFNRTILIVGGAGFIGSHLADKLLEGRNNKIIILDNLFTGNKENVNWAMENGAILHIDDAENFEILQYIVETYDIDIVFNCATKPLNYSFINPSNAFLTNVVVLKNLLELQRKQEFQTLCHFSSSEAYGSALYEPMDEEHPLLPTTSYAAGKAAADLMLQSYVKMFDLDAFIVRPFNNYGPRQNFSGPLAGIIPVTIKKILDGHPPEIHGSGKQTRDFIYVNDTVDLVCEVFSKIIGGECVNITTNQQLAISEVVKIITEELSYNGNITKKPGRKADVVSHRGSDKKLHSLVGDYKKTDFRGGIRATIQWMKQLPL